MEKQEELKKKVKELTKKLIFESRTEQEDEKIWEELEKLVPDPQYSDYVFYPDGGEQPPSASEADLTDEELKKKVEEDIDQAIEKAFAYKPIIL